MRIPLIVFAVFAFVQTTAAQSEGAAIKPGYLYCGSPVGIRERFSNAFRAGNLCDPRRKIVLPNMRALQAAYCASSDEWIKYRVRWLALTRDSCRSIVMPQL